MKYLKLYESFEDFENEEIDDELYSDILQDYHDDERELSKKYKLIERLTTILNKISDFEEDKVLHIIMRNDMELYGKLFLSDSSLSYGITIGEINYRKEEVRPHLSDMVYSTDGWILDFQYRNISNWWYNINEVHPKVLYKIIKTLLSSPFVNGLINNSAFNKIND